MDTAVGRALRGAQHMEQDLGQPRGQRATPGREPTRKQGPPSYEHKKLHSANKNNILGRGFSPSDLTLQKVNFADSY